MKDFQLHFTGTHEDLKKILEVAKAVIDEVRAAGGGIEGYFSSGHLLGGSRNVDEIHADNPAKLADGTVHPAPTEQSPASEETPVEDA